MAVIQVNQSFQPFRAGREGRTGSFGPGAAGLRYTKHPLCQGADKTFWGLLGASGGAPVKIGGAGEWIGTCAATLNVVCGGLR